MARFVIKSDMKVSEVWTQFDNAFISNWYLRVYVNPSTKGRMAEGKERLCDLNCTIKPGEIEVVDKISVGDFENLIRNTFGFGVQVAKSRWNTDSSELVKNTEILSARATPKPEPIPEPEPKPEPEPEPKKEEKRGGCLPVILFVVAVGVGYLCYSMGLFG